MLAHGGLLGLFTVKVDCDEMKLEEKVFVVDRKEVAVNVNTLEDLKVAEHLFSHHT